MINKTRIAQMCKDCIDSQKCDKNTDLQYECLNIELVDDSLGIELW